MRVRPAVTNSHASAYRPTNAPTRPRVHAREGATSRTICSVLTSRGLRSRTSHPSASYHRPIGWLSRQSHPTTNHRPQTTHIAAEVWIEGPNAQLTGNSEAGRQF